MSARLRVAAHLRTLRAFARSGYQDYRIAGAPRLHTSPDLASGGDFRCLHDSENGVSAAGAQIWGQRLGSVFIGAALQPFRVFRKEKKRISESSGTL
jgi:hypothetical protein